MFGSRSSCSWRRRILPLSVSSIFTLLSDRYLGATDHDIRLHYARFSALDLFTCDVNDSISEHADKGSLAISIAKAGPGPRTIFGASPIDFRFSLRHYFDPPVRHRLNLAYFPVPTARQREPVLSSLYPLAIYFPLQYLNILSIAGCVTYLSISLAPLHATLLS